jgi:hypothetical protein
MKPARLIREGSATFRLQICDEARAQHALQCLVSQGKLTINGSLHWGTITIFRDVTGGPGNSVH